MICNDLQRSATICKDCKGGGCNECNVQRGAVSAWWAAVGCDSVPPSDTVCGDEWQEHSPLARSVSETSLTLRASGARRTFTPDTGPPVAQPVPDLAGVQI